MPRRKLFQQTAFVATKPLPTFDRAGLVCLCAALTLLLGSACLASTTDKRSSKHEGGGLERTDQSKAIEAAALSAASDISKIVVTNKKFAMVGLADYDAPRMPKVHGINTILGTIRLDMIIADKLEQRLLKDLAARDLHGALEAKDQLIARLANAIKPNGRGLDKDGRAITPYANALRTYRSRGSQKNAESLVLTLGCHEGGTTIVPIPKPEGVAPLLDSQRSGGFYRPYVNVAYGGANFVFGSIGNSVSLLEPTKWKEKITGLPYQIPTVVKAEAWRVFSKGSAGNRAPGAVACAQPGSCEKLLATGASIMLDFPSGSIAKINAPKDLYSSALLKDSNSGAIMAAPMFQDAGSRDKALEASVGGIWLAALYDWMRNGGPEINVDSVIKMQKASLGKAPVQPKKLRAPLLTGGPYLPIGTIPTGITHIFSLEPDGSVKYQTKVSAVASMVPSHRDDSTFGISVFPALSSKQEAKEALRSVFDSRLDVEPRIVRVPPKRNASVANGVATNVGSHPEPLHDASSPRAKSTESETRIAEKMSGGKSEFRKNCIFKEKEGLWKRINWMPNIQEAVKKATRENKPLLVVMVVRHQACQGVPDV